jgi:hypothetical protein
MKTILTLLLAIVAVTAAAQAPAFDPWLQWESRPYTQDVHITSIPQDTYIIQGSRFSFDGIGVEIARADNPLKLFDPFNAEMLETSRENVVWDANTGRAIGFNLFSIHF